MSALSILRSITPLLSFVLSLQAASPLTTAQEVGQQPTSAATAAAAPTTTKLLLREGTEIKLKFADDLNSKTAAEGDAVTFVLDEPVKVGDVIVIRQGAKARGTITNAKKARMLGRPGELGIELQHLRADSGRVALRGSKEKEGQGKQGAVVALTVLFGTIGLIKHGENVEVKAGTPLVAYVDQDIQLDPAK